MAVDIDPILADCVDFARRLIRTPSMSGDEAAIAGLVAAELEQLGYDEVWRDRMGNVYGRVYGRDRSLPALVLNTHLDHVDPGDPSQWPAPPYAAEIRDGRILGRGAVDIKGPMAVQVYSPVALLQAGERPRRDLVFCGVVEEEIGGAGAVFWVEQLDYPVELVVLGEPSSNQMALGHRGGAQLWVKFTGRSVHASVPEQGENPNYALATFLSRLPEAKQSLRSHSVLGPTSVAPTIIEVDTTSPNVTPAWTRVLLDCRTAVESVASLTAWIDHVAADLPHTVALLESGLAGVDVAADETITGFYTPPDAPVVETARTLLGRGMGREPALTRYAFATDGRHFVPYGLTMIGYAPGDENLAHTVRESIAIDSMAENLRGLIQLLRAF